MLIIDKINSYSFLQLSKGGNEEATRKLDAQLKLLQNKSVSMLPKKADVPNNKIEPSDILAKAKPVNVDSLVDQMDTAEMSTKSKKK